MLSLLYDRYPRIRTYGRPLFEVPVLFLCLLAGVWAASVTLDLPAALRTRLPGIAVLLALWSAASTWRYTERPDRFYRPSLIFVIRFAAAVLALPVLYLAFWPMTYAASLLSAAGDSVTRPWVLPVTAAVFIATGTLLAMLGGWLLTIRRWPGLLFASGLLMLLAAERVFTADILHPLYPTHIAPAEARATLRSLGFVHIREAEPWRRNPPPARVTPRPPVVNPLLP